MALARVSHFFRLLNQRSTGIVYRNCYSDTRKNLRIDKRTKVIVQGFSTSLAILDFSERAIRHGTKIVAGVQKGHSGVRLGVPVFNTILEAVENTDATATVIYDLKYVAANAIVEAVHAKVPLIVCTTEGIPLNDMALAYQVVMSQNKSRLVGPSSNGVIKPGGCRLGVKIPVDIYQPGKIGIVSKCGTLTYEAVAQTTRAGLGQSLCIGIGGDHYRGTDFVDCLEVFLEDSATKGILLIGEIGGDEEEKAAEYLKEKNIGYDAKPVVAFVAGLTAPEGRRIGHHAGAIISDGKGGAEAKMEALESAGVVVTRNPALMGPTMLEVMKQKRLA